MHNPTKPYKNKIILGSSSKWRKMILEKMGYEFDIISPDVDEKAIRFEDPAKLTLTLAKVKSRAILLKLNEPCILITSDQVGFSNGRILEKPINADEARKFLRSYAYYPIESYAAVVVVNSENNKKAEGVDIARVSFSPFPEDFIELIIKKGDVLNAAGGFTIGDPLFDPYVKEIKGEKENIMGLPVKMTEKFLEEVTN